jgi:hypothetical protein
MAVRCIHFSGSTSVVGGGCRKKGAKGPRSFGQGTPLGAALRDLPPAGFFAFGGAFAWGFAGALAFAVALAFFAFAFTPGFVRMGPPSLSPPRIAKILLAVSTAPLARVGVVGAVLRL